MEDLVHKGLVKSIGVSNFSPEKIQALLETATIRPAVNQVSRLRAQGFTSSVQPQLLVVIMDHLLVRLQLSCTVLLLHLLLDTMQAKLHRVLEM